ncbi:MAG TPA: hypothetical protein VK982_13065 [Bacteroidales bacterium]|nr:hypothetical protein [Bacteroidales bacterium]
MRQDNDLIALIEGPGREMIFYKEVILLDISEDKTFKTVNFMDKGLVAMTPSFTLDGENCYISDAVVKIETVDGIIQLEGGERSQNPENHSFSASWDIDEPFEVDKVKAIIINDTRIPVK